MLLKGLSYAYFRGEQTGLKGIGCGGGAARGGKAFRHAPGASGHGHRRADLGAEPVGTQAASGESRSGARDLHTTRDLELVASKGHDADRDAPRERLLGRAHAAVRDGAHGTSEYRAMWDEAFQVGVRRDVKAPRLPSGQRGDDHHGLSSQCLEGRLDEPSIILELRGRGDQDERLFDRCQPRWGIGWRSHAHGPTSTTCDGQSRRGYSNGSAVR